jgi:ubiquitin-protein ligase
LRDWEVKNLIPKLIDLWPSITLPLVPLYVKVLSVCANMHKTTQESVGSFLVNLIKSSGTDPKKQQAVFELMEGLLSTQDNLYVSLQHADDRTEEVQGLGVAPVSSKTVPLEWDSTNAGPAILDSANVKKTTADYCYTTVKSVEAFNSGVYYFEVEIVNSTGNIFVGICEFTHQHNCYLGQYNSMNVSSYGLMGTASPYFYCAISTEGTTKSFGKAFTKGDIIGCEVDFDAGTLTYFKNGETIGTPHDKGFKDKEYHAAVTLYAPNDEVNLVSATRTGAAKIPNKNASNVPKKPTNTKEPLPFSLSLDSPLRFHRSTNVYCVPTNTPFIDFFNEIQTRERMKNSEGQVQISISANGKALTASALATQELLAQSFSRADVGDCEIIDLQFNTQMMPINQQDVQVQIPKDVGGNSKIAEIVVKSKGLTLLVDNVLNYIKDQNKKKPEDHLTTWMKWLDVLKSQTQIEGYSTKFLQHKGCRALLFKAMKGELNLTPSKELIGATVATVPPIQAKERDALAVELDMFEPLLKSFGQLFAHTAVSAEDKVSKAVRLAALENGLVDRLLINLSDLTNTDMRNPNKFMKNGLYVELRDKSKREKDKREKERAANKANKSYWAKGTGYGTSSDAQNTWDQTTFAKIIELKSKQQAMMLNAVAAYLDVPAATEGESHLPNVTEVYDLLESSCVVPVLLSYLRNDSLLDIAKQMDLYNSLFNMVQVIARQPEFAGLLDILPNESGSVHQLMNQLNNMAQMMLKNTEKAKKIVETNPKSKDDSKRELEELSMAKFIISVASDVKKSLDAKQAKLKKEKDEKDKKDKPSSEGKKESKQEEKDDTDIDVDAMEEITGDTEEDKKKMERNKQKKEKLDKFLSSKNMTLGTKYKLALVDLQFGERDMTKSGGGYVHHYATRISQESSAMPNKLKRLVQEISSLSTGLPLIPESSVFMRVDQDRPDVMTAMITGPPGTPYSNGCYEFHIYCPSDYPKVPPVVNLETTGHGSVRFNPNLYNCGKVCLSLLGTWSGQQNEQWNEKTSTILQVLVSIQSLIMVERPYYNEPGYESQMGTYNGEKQSKAYVDNIRVQSIRWAMVDQLKNPSPGYEDVIKTHFKIKKQVIYREINQWIKDSSSSQAKLLQEQFDQLKKLVDALGD